jgi:hypothetical protein
MALASQDRTHKRGGPQGRALMRATVFEQKRLIINHHQQQVAASDLEGLPVAFAQIDQSLKGIKHRVRTAIQK